MELEFEPQAFIELGFLLFVSIVEQVVCVGV